MKPAKFIRPYSAEQNSDATLANYPKLIYLLHADDFVVGSSTFSPRVGNSVIAYGNQLGKLSDGSVYAVAPNDGTFVTTGTQPTYKVGKYYLQIYTGRAPSDGTTASFRFGATIGTSVSHNGAMYRNSVQALTSIAISGIVDLGLEHCNLIYYDWVSLNTPVGHYRAYYSKDGTKSDTSSTDTQFSAPAAGGNLVPENGISICISDHTFGPLNATFWIGALFELNNPLTSSFMNSTAAWMAANPGKLYPGLRGLS